MPLVKAGPAPESTGYDGPRLQDHINRIVVLMPTEETTQSTAAYGDRPITKANGWAWTEKSKKLEELGEQYVWWGKVRAQLRQAGIGSFVVGKLAKDGQAYVLDSTAVEDATLALIEERLDDSTEKPF